MINIFSKQDIEKAKLFLKSIAKLLIAIGFILLVILGIGIFDYIKIKRADNDYQEHIELLEATIIEQDLELTKMKKLIKQEKIAIEDEQRKRKRAEKLRDKAINDYNYYLRVLAESSDKERNDILEEVANFKYEN